ncbi:MAG TPA: hypothetical protein VJN18_15245 [Polyangiaceae bacterium]|nr:hypothetical protein [Polyangiaceae bacterium]
MKRFVLLSMALLVASFQVRAAAEIFGAYELSALSNAITELDLQRAQKLAKRSDSETPQFLFERARLLVHLGDCVGAVAVLSNPAVTSSSDGAQLAQTAKSCAHATAAGFVIEDKERGIWLRLQDDADRVLSPFIFRVAAQARDRIGAELGVDMPRPLRIDLVRDLFSLSAVTGLRLEAAETTGTLAVARFGRIIMLSPQATPSGYHWEDTLAHELTHLLVTRATRDRAPLWLQEGVAKRQENRWREPRPFDQKGWADATAARALRAGQQVGLDKLGPSIAMLPTPEAAATAYAEVQSFVSYFVREQGEPALRLLFADLKGLAADDPSSALRSVTGYDLGQWNLRWQKSLLDAPSDVVEQARRGAPIDARDLARRARLGDLLLHSGYGHEAASVLAPGVAGGSPSYRFRMARAELARKDPQQAAARLGVETEIDGLYGPWFSLRGRLLETADPAGAARAFALGLSADPLAEEVACEGRFSLGPRPDDARLPVSSDWRQLCEAARKQTRD